MWKNKYGNEPADLKLLAIRFFRKIWFLLLAVILGAAICGTGYFVKHVVLAPAPTYIAHSMMYVDFVRGEDREPKYYTFNTAGWSGFVKTDEILDRAMEVLAGQEYSGAESQNSTNIAEETATLTTPITKEELRESVDASVDADYRVVDLLVTSTDPQRAVIIAHAVEQAFPVFGQSMQEIEQVRVMTSADVASRVWADTATYRVVIWGGIFGGLLVFFILFIQVSLDDSVYVPDTLRRRYGYPVLGVRFAKRENAERKDAETQNEEQQNEQHQNIGNGRKQFQEAMKKQLAENTAYFCGDAKILTLPTGQKENVLQNPERLSELDACDGVILEVPAGTQNGKILEETIGQIEQREKKIYGMILTEADEKLWKAYYNSLWTRKEK